MGTPPRVDVRARSSVLRQASACAVVSDDGRLNKNYPIAAAIGAFYCSDIEMHYSLMTIRFIETSGIVPRERGRQRSSILSLLIGERPSACAIRKLN
jgi:hypothetical protein